jgi:hypothetical protein
VKESKVFVAMVLILIFAEVLGLYGCVLIAAAQHQRVAESQNCAGSLLH